MVSLSPPEYSFHLLTSHLSNRKRTSLLKRAGSLLVLLTFFHSFFLSASAVEETSEEIPRSEVAHTPQRSLLFGEGDEGPDAKLPELPCFRLRRPDEENLIKRDARDESLSRHPVSHGKEEETADSVEKADRIASGGFAGGSDVQEDKDEGEFSSGGNQRSSTLPPRSRNEMYVDSVGRLLTGRDANRADGRQER